ncbi:hypothetical protein ACLB2K_040763 [Fragaria x ananassa]
MNSLHSTRMMVSQSEQASSQQCTRRFFYHRGTHSNKLRRMNPEKPFRLNLFKDCERRAIAKLLRHRSEEKSNNRQRATE